MIKNDRWIRRWAESGGVDPYEPDQVNAASFDVRVSEHWICPTREPEEFNGDHVKLFPGEVVLASTLEYVKIPRDVACDLKLKSTLGRLWINHSKDMLLVPPTGGAPDTPQVVEPGTFNRSIPAMENPK